MASLTILVLLAGLWIQSALALIPKIRPVVWWNVTNTDEPRPAVDVERRGTVGGVYICDDVNWSGRCGYKVQPLDTCIRLGSDWDGLISSFGPDPCTQCWAYDGDSCNGQPMLPFIYPGKADGGLGSNTVWNDQISSFECRNICP